MGPARARAPCPALLLPLWRHGQDFNVGAGCSFPLIHHGSSLQSVLLATTASGTLKLGTKTLSWTCWRRPTPRSTGWSGYTRWVGRSAVGAVLHHAAAASHAQRLCFPGQRPGQPRALEDIKPFHRIIFAGRAGESTFILLFGLNKKATWGFVDALTRFFILDQFV